MKRRWSCVERLGLTPKDSDEAHQLLYLAAFKQSDPAGFQKYADEMEAEQARLEARMRAEIAATKQRREAEQHAQNAAAQQQARAQTFKRMQPYISKANKVR